MSTATWAWRQWFCSDWCVREASLLNHYSFTKREGPLTLAAFSTSLRTDSFSQLCPCWLMSNWCLPTLSRVSMNLGMLLCTLLSALLQNRHLKWFCFLLQHAFNSLGVIPALTVGSIWAKPFAIVSMLFFCVLLCLFLSLWPAVWHSFPGIQQRNLAIAFLWHRLLLLLYPRNKTHSCFCCHLFCPKGSHPHPASPSPWPHDCSASCMSHFPLGLAEAQANHANWLKLHSQSCDHHSHETFQLKLFSSETNCLFFSKSQFCII